MTFKHWLSLTVVTVALSWLMVGFVCGFRNLVAEPLVQSMGMIFTLMCPVMILLSGLGFDAKDRDLERRNKERQERERRRIENGVYEI